MVSTAIIVWLLIQIPLGILVGKALKGCLR
jgi:hypothetical protein